jgi:hypothetical protein
MEKWKNNNKPMRRKSDFAAQNEEGMWPIYALSRLLAIFSLHILSLGLITSGRQKTCYIKMTLFGLYLICYQPHLSIFESF